MVLAQKVKLSSSIHPAVITAGLFSVLLGIEVWLFKLKEDFKIYWSLKKLPWLFGGVIGGAAIGLTPELIALATGQGEFQGSSFLNHSTMSWVITFVISGWEELWFRGMFINHCQRHLSSYTIAGLVGLLFMVVHALNPEMDLLVSGPSLFLAGTMLTMAYIVSRSIWLPIGLHFGNNFFGSSLDIVFNKKTFFSEDGYLSALILLMVTLLFIWLEKRKTHLSRLST